MGACIPPTPACGHPPAALFHVRTWVCSPSSQTRGKAHKCPLPSASTCHVCLVFTPACTLPKSPRLCARTQARSPAHPGGHPKMSMCFLTPVCTLAPLLMWDSARDPHSCHPPTHTVTSLRRCSQHRYMPHTPLSGHTTPIHTTPRLVIHPNPRIPRDSSFLSFSLSNPSFTPRDALISPREDGGSGGMPAGPGGAGRRGAGSGTARLPVCQRRCPRVASSSGWL